MTGTEIVVVIGGLVVGYWIVAVVLPMLGAPMTKLATRMPARRRKLPTRPASTRIPKATSRRSAGKCE